MLEKMFLEATRVAPESLSVALTEITKQAVVLGDVPMQASTPICATPTIELTLKLATKLTPYL